MGDSATDKHYTQDHNVYDSNGNQVKADKPPYVSIPVNQQGLAQKAVQDARGRGKTIEQQIAEQGG